MTDDLSARLRGLMAKATQGEWELHSTGRYIFADGLDGSVLFCTVDEDGIHGNKDGDLPLIVAAINALPTLLDRIDALQAEIERLRGHIEKLDVYARHNGLCAAVGGYGYCTCGLEDIRKAAP